MTELERVALIFLTGAARKLAESGRTGLLPMVRRAWSDERFRSIWFQCAYERWPGATEPRELAKALSRTWRAALRWAREGTIHRQDTEAQKIAEPSKDAGEGISPEDIERAIPQTAERIRQVIEEHGRWCTEQDAIALARWVWRLCSRRQLPTGSARTLARWFPRDYLFDRVVNG